MSPGARTWCAVLCALWAVVAALRVVAWMLGRPGGRVSLVLGLVAGAAGVVGLVVYVLNCREQRS